MHQKDCDCIGQLQQKVAHSFIHRGIRFQRVHNPLHLVATIPFDVASSDAADVPRGAEGPRPIFEFLTVRELAERVVSVGHRKWLVRGIFPGGDYGIHAAEMKAQKTWNAIDLAVSVSSETPWLGHLPVDDPGPVLIFVGEGGQANILRRIRAVAEERGIVAEDLPIVVCTRAPHLSDLQHMLLLEKKISHMKLRLVIIDPLYLAAGGANLKDLYQMGTVLETVQLLCQAAGAGLLLITHFNRGQGQGASRITGAGPAEWGRVLMMSTVKSRQTNPTTKETRVITEMDIIGGEIPDQTLRIDRRVWTDNPDDLNSPMHIRTNVTTGDAAEDGVGNGTVPPDILANLARQIERYWRRWRRQRVRRRSPD